jgi:hypothetical protein
MNFIEAVKFLGDEDPGSHIIRRIGIQMNYIQISSGGMLYEVGTTYNSPVLYVVDISFASDWEIVSMKQIQQEWEDERRSLEIIEE